CSSVVARSEPAVALGPPNPCPQRLRLAADLPGHRRNRRPLGAVLALVVQDHPHRPLTHLGCVPRQFVAHGSILSRFGASGKAGAIHIADWLRGKSFPMQPEPLRQAIVLPSYMISRR